MGERPDPTITTRKITDDYWKAWLSFNPVNWEAGVSESQAVGRLVMSYPEFFGGIKREAQQSKEAAHE